MPRRDTFTAIHTEGALLPPDLLRRIADGDRDVGGLAPDDYHLPGEKINEAVTRAWNRAVAAWANLKAALDKLPPGDTGTTATRERWLLPLFQELGYGRLQTALALELDGRSFPLSHRWGHVPIHLVGWNVDLDTRTAGVAGAARTSPHGLLQEALNRSDAHLWGFLSNGRRLRLLRDNSSLTRQAYLEFDLETMLEGEDYADFVLLWLLCHQSRVESERPEECRLEQWSQFAQQQGIRALDGLRRRVEDAITALGAGFLAHPANGVLSAKLCGGTLSAQDYYRQVLRLVYRLIFAFAAEDRELLLDPEASEEAKARYLRYYSTRRLRRLAERRRGTPHPDLWCALSLVFTALGADAPTPALALRPLGSFLWSAETAPDLAGCDLANRDLLAAVRSLAFTEHRGALRPVDYRNLGAEELGSVYESLLELHPEVNLDAGTFAVRPVTGNERKTTGSYYTHPDLVAELIKSALVPVLEDRLSKAATLQAKEQALLGLTVCDPACGSGHFLIAAARRLGQELARLRTGDEEPAPVEVRRAIREVIRHCLYGVDLNPMSVELCKVALWMEGHTPGLPLAFLDHRIKCGNSLVGVFDTRPSEVPDAAFTPITADDKRVASTVKKLNKEEREGTRRLPLGEPEPVPDAEVNAYARVALLPEEAAGDVAAKEREYHRWEHSAPHQRRKLECNTWCAAFFWPLTEEETWFPTTAPYLRVLAEPSSVPVAARRRITELSERHRFFHWHLEFPDVMGRGGFDVVLGNPPWERIKLQQQEFFAAHDPAIAGAPNKAARETLIRQLPERNPELHAAYQEALRGAGGESCFSRGSGRFPLGARGDINTYVLFAELSRDALCDLGRAGIIIPPGIATDDTTKAFLADLLRTRTLTALTGMDNEAMLYFPGIDHRNRFALACLCGPSVAASDPVFAFTCSRLEHAALPVRRFRLSADDMALLNPNTRTCPTFRTSVDAELTKAIYRLVPVLVREARDGEPEEDPWGVGFATMFHMANDSGLFETGDALPGERSSRLLPLYEAKLIHQFDHRWATYDGVPAADLHKGLARDLSDREKWDPSCAVQPRYWVAEHEVILRTSRVPPEVVKGYRARDSELLSQAIPYWLAGHHYSHGRSRAGEWVFKGLRFTSPISALLNTSHAQRLASDWPLTEDDLASVIAFCDGQADDGEVDWMGLAWMLIKRKVPRWHIGFRDVTKSVNERTAIAAPLPPAAAGHTLPLLLLSETPRLRLCALGNLNSLVFDYLLRSKIGGSHLSFFVLQQVPVLPPHRYDEADLAFIAPRVLELTYTAWDLQPFAQDVGYDGPPFVWNPERRALLRAELDAYYAHLYGLTRKQIRYLLDPHNLTDRELEDILDPTEDPSDAPCTKDFPGETFRVLKARELNDYGEYRTYRLVMAAYDALAESRSTGQSYESPLDPPPADPRCCHPLRETAPSQGELQ